MNRPKLHEVLTGGLLAFVFFVPLYLGSVIWGVADHPSAKIGAIFFGAVCFVCLKTFYYYFVFLGVQQDCAGPETP